MTSQDLLGFLPFVAIFVVFWFLVLRPARKKQQAVSSLRSSLEVGDSVLLGSGMYGKIESVEDEGRTLRLEIAPGVVVRAHRDAVVQKEQPPTQADGDPTDERPEERPGDGQPT